MRLAIVESLLLGDLAPDEVARSAGLASNALAHHLNVLREVGLVTVTRSHGDGRRRYLRLDAERLDGLVRSPSLEAQEVLFVCSANAARSQLAAALWARTSDVPCASAGRHPAVAIPEVTRHAAERLGVDLAEATPSGYDAVDTVPGLVVSVCDVAREADDLPFAAPRLHWSVPDPLAPAGASIDDVVAELQRRVARLAPQVRAA